MHTKILSIDASFSVGKVAFGLARNAKSVDFSRGNCKIAWDRLVSKCVLHTALSLLKLKKELPIEKDSNEWISTLEGLQIQMNEFWQKGSISDEDFMIHVPNNLPKEYVVRMSSKIASQWVGTMHLQLM